MVYCALPMEQGSDVGMFSVAMRGCCYEQIDRTVIHVSALHSL